MYSFTDIGYVSDENINIHSSEMHSIDICVMQKNVKHYSPISIKILERRDRMLYVLNGKTTAEKKQQTHSIGLMALYGNRAKQAA